MKNRIIEGPNKHTGQIKNYEEESTKEAVERGAQRNQTIKSIASVLLHQFYLHASFILANN